MDERKKVILMNNESAVDGEMMSERFSSAGPRKLEIAVINASINVSVNIQI